MAMTIGLAKVAGARKDRYLYFSSRSNREYYSRFGPNSLPALLENVDRLIERAQRELRKRPRRRYDQR